MDFSDPPSLRFSIGPSSMTKTDPKEVGLTIGSPPVQVTV